ncbi:MAG: hypothetical protein JO147_10890 [Actinobacteria bacterium]|nr:hypothetical protein [Actinomycetota bacterium]
MTDEYSPISGWDPDHIPEDATVSRRLLATISERVDWDETMQAFAQAVIDLETLLNGQQKSIDLLVRIVDRDH